MSNYNQILTGKGSRTHTDPACCPDASAYVLAYSNNGCIYTCICIYIYIYLTNINTDHVSSESCRRTNNQERREKTMWRVHNTFQFVRSRLCVMGHPSRSLVPQFSWKWAGYLVTKRQTEPIINSGSCASLGIQCLTCEITTTSFVVSISFYPLCHSLFDKCLLIEYSLTRQNNHSFGHWCFCAVNYSEGISG